MCGRSTWFATDAALAKAFPRLRHRLQMELAPRYNIAPTQLIPAITNADPGELRLLRWGLIPGWAKDPSIGNRLFNARVETIAEKPAYRPALRKHRCLVLSTGFYEWASSGSKKRPVFIARRDRLPFAFAGLSASWHPDDENLETCVIITGPPNALLAPIHHRMPVILPAALHDDWLSAETSEAGAVAMLLPYDDDAFEAFEVSSRVNSTRNDGAELIMPVAGVAPDDHADTRTRPNRDAADAMLSLFPTDQ